MCLVVSLTVVVNSCTSLYVSAWGSSYSTKFICNVGSMSTEHPELNDILIYLTIYKVSFYLCYRAFHGFGQAKLSDGGLILGSSQFPILPQLP